MSALRAWPLAPFAPSRVGEAGLAGPGEGFGRTPSRLPLIRLGCAEPTFSRKVRRGALHRCRSHCGGGRRHEPRSLPRPPSRPGVILVTLTRGAGLDPARGGRDHGRLRRRDRDGTIGGGQLEFHCIDIAAGHADDGRDRARPRHPARAADGPVLRRPCAGVAEAGGRGRARLGRGAREGAGRDDALPSSSSAQAIPGGRWRRRWRPCPSPRTLIDDRDGVLDGLPAAITCIRMADPVAGCGRRRGPAAPSSCSRHSHALDYRLTEAALARGDAAYLGMIGSATKRARFESGFLRAGGRREALARLTCPIGGSDVDDKRPEVIAALTAAELVRSLLGERRRRRRRWQS